MFYGNPYGGRLKLINILLDSGIGVDIYSNIYSKANSIEQDFFSNMIGWLISLINYSRYNTGRKIILSRLLGFYKETKIRKNSNVNYYDSIEYTELPSKILEYRLVLSPSSIRSTGLLKNPVYVSNLRDAEILSMGGIPLVEKIATHQEIFLKNKGIIELSESKMDYIKHFLYNLPSKEIRKIQMTNFVTSRRSHTWEFRFLNIFDFLSK
jgi:hypothetical protein